MGARRRVVLLCASTALAAVALGSAGRAEAQPITIPESPPPDQPPEIVDPPLPDVPPEGERRASTAGPPEPPAPRNVRGNPAGIDLTTLETDDLSLLYFDPMQTYLTPYIARGVRKCAAVRAQIVRLDAVGPDDGAAQGFFRLRQRGGAIVAQQCDAARRRAAEPVVRDVQPGRALLHADEPRAGSRRDDGRVEPDRRAAAQILRRQADADPGASRIDPLFLSDDAAGQRAALVSRRQRGVHGNLDGGRLRPRPGRL